MKFIILQFRKRKKDVIRCYFTSSCIVLSTCFQKFNLCLYYRWKDQLCHQFLALFLLGQDVLLSQMSLHIESNRDDHYCGYQIDNKYSFSLLLTHCKNMHLKDKCLINFNLASWWTSLSIYWRMVNLGVNFNVNLMVNFSVHVIDYSVFTFDLSYKSNTGTSGGSRTFRREDPSHINAREKFLPRPLWQWHAHFWAEKLHLRGPVE